MHNFYNLLRAKPAEEKKRPIPVHAFHERPGNQIPRGLERPRKLADCEGEENRSKMFTESAVLSDFKNKPDEINFTAA